MVRPRDAPVHLHSGATSEISRKALRPALGSDRYGDPYPVADGRGDFFGGTFRVFGLGARAGRSRAGRRKSEIGSAERAALGWEAPRVCADGAGGETAS